MSDINAFKFKEQQDYLNDNFKSVADGSANIVETTAVLVSGTTKTSAEGFGKCRVGSIIIATVSGVITAYLVTAVASDKVITGVTLS